jgi:hypothetical protein
MTTTTYNAKHLLLAAVAIIMLLGNVVLIAQKKLQMQLRMKKIRNTL